MLCNHGQLDKRFSSPSYRFFFLEVNDDVIVSTSGTPERRQENAQAQTRVVDLLFINEHSGCLFLHYEGWNDNFELKLAGFTEIWMMFESVLCSKWNKQNYRCNYSALNITSAFSLFAIPGVSDSIFLPGENDAGLQVWTASEWRSLDLLGPVVALAEFDQHKTWPRSGSFMG